jgi:hypothetical protein
MMDKANKTSTFSIPLRSTDRIDECPEETHCQLSVHESTHTGALSIVGGVSDSEKLVKIRLTKKGAGCDYKVMVGLSTNGGPIAIGAEEVAGQENIVFRFWERRLNICRPPKRIFLSDTPFHLLNARYRVGREYISLIVCQMKKDANWQVIVDRRGGYSAIPLVKKYSTSHDDLHVSAALSANCNNLYVVLSRQAGNQYHGTYEHHTYNQYSGEWTLYRSGQVPKPTEIPSNLPYSVSREGLVSGFWAIEKTTRLVSYSEDGNCGAPIHIPGTNYSKYYYDGSVWWGGYWSIISGEYSQGIFRAKGHVLLGGDISLVGESVSSSFNHLYQNTEYRWAGQADPGTYHGAWYRWQDSSNDDALNFFLNIGKTRIATKDTGLTFRFSAYSEQITDVTIGTPTTVHDTWNITYHNYSYHDGTTSVHITPGGWVTVQDDAIVRSCNLSPFAYDDVRIIAGIEQGWGQSFCPDMLSKLESTGVDQQHRVSNSIAYPQFLGEHKAILCSFSAVDVESGTEYCGAKVQYQENGPATWKIFKNDINVTAEVGLCIKRPLNELGGIYWRA